MRIDDLMLESKGKNEYTFSINLFVHISISILRFHWLLILKIAIKIDSIYLVIHWNHFILSVCSMNSLLNAIIYSYWSRWSCYSSFVKRNVWKKCISCFIICFIIDLLTKPFKIIRYQINSTIYLRFFLTLHFLLRNKNCEL